MADRTASLRGKLSAATKRINEEREFGLKQHAETEQVKAEMRKTIDLAVTAIKALELAYGDEVIYFLRTRLRAELVALHPALGERRLKPAE